MSLTSSELQSLRALTCFEEDIVISAITNGMSHTCVKVTTTLQSFFVKRLNPETAKKEVYCSKYTAISGLSPPVIYSDNIWLITEFIHVNQIDQVKPCSNNISTGLSLMGSLHQLPPISTSSIIPLDINNTLETLIYKLNSLTPLQRTMLTNVSHVITLHINELQKLSGSSSVLCHGDINYNNILSSDNKKAWLIDFECAQLAPLEFDLGMFIAINNIPTEKVSDIVIEYMKVTSHNNVNTELLTYYILFSYFINALWFFDNSDKLDSDDVLFKLTAQQLIAFDNFAATHDLPFPRLLSLIA